MAKAKGYSHHRRYQRQDSRRGSGIRIVDIETGRVTTGGGWAEFLGHRRDKRCYQLSGKPKPKRPSTRFRFRREDN
jgi:hypothetical protein